MPPNGTLTMDRSAPVGTSLPRPRRPLLSRFSTAHGLMVLSGLLTLILVVSATKGSNARVMVAAASGDIPAGAPLTGARLHAVDLPADSNLAGLTVLWDRIGLGDQVAARPIGAGELLRPSDLVAGAGSGSSQLRGMSIPVKQERAVGGALRVGDRVDVIDVVDGTARWVVTGAQVIEVPAPAASKGIVRDAGGVYHVVVEVSAGEALALAEALTHDTVSVIRSTGAPPPDATSGSSSKAVTTDPAPAPAAPAPQPSTPPAATPPPAAPAPTSAPGS